MIDERLIEISEALTDLYAQKKLGNASPGLLEAIRRQEALLTRFKESRDLWIAVLKVYPNYDR